MVGGQWGEGAGGLATFCSTFTPPEVVTKVAKWWSFIINTQAVDLPILPTMTSGGERRDARGRGLNLVLLPHHFLTHFTFFIKAL